MNKITFKIILVLFIFVLISCNKKYINFEEYITNNIFYNKNLLENNIYEIDNLDYNARLVYHEEGTHFGIYEDPDMSKRLFDLKYYTKIEPFEIIIRNEKFLAKIRTMDNKIGWINAEYIELFK